MNSDDKRHYAFMDTDEINTTPISLAGLDAAIDKEINQLTSQENALSKLVKKCVDFISAKVGPNYQESITIANNSMASSQKLHELSTHASGRVRRSVAKNPSTDFQTILDMHHDKNNSFITPLWVTMHKSAPSSWVSAMAHTMSSDELPYLLHKDNLSFETLELIAYKRGDVSSEVIEHAKDVLRSKVDAFSQTSFTPSELHGLAVNSNSNLELLCAGIHDDILPEAFLIIADRLKEDDLVRYTLLQDNAREDLVAMITTKPSDNAPSPSEPHQSPTHPKR